MKRTSFRLVQRFLTVLAVTVIAVAVLPITAEGRIWPKTMLETVSPSLVESSSPNSEPMTPLEERLAMMAYFRAQAEAQAAAEEAHEVLLATRADEVNQYLKGTPLEGQGIVFVLAAEQYGIDYRLSPAISCIESGKGAHCFRPYNAWGMMVKYRFSSWEEGIYANVKLIATKYGGSITKQGAKRYCTSNNNWYYQVMSEVQKMDSI